MTTISKPQFSVSVPFKRMQAAHPDLQSDEILKIYRNYLRSLSLVDPTPANDVIGWIARRMTGQRVLDAIIVAYGNRGDGKSYGCGYIGERLDVRLSKQFNKPPGSFFSIDNVRSVDKTGSLEMLTPKVMKKTQNQIYILDDASITTNARNFQSQTNKNLNDILTTARIYRHCIILNTVSSNLIDAVARSYADIGILFEGIIPGTTINKCKVFRMSQSNHMGFGKGAKDSIGKYFQLTINGEQYRMKTWYINKPSDEWCKAYDEIRKENTDKLGDEEDEQNTSVSNRKKINAREKKRKEMIEKYYKPVIALHQKGVSISAMARELGTTREWVEVMLAENKRRQEDAS